MLFVIITFVGFLLSITNSDTSAEVAEEEEETKCVWVHKAIYDSESNKFRYQRECEAKDIQTSVELSLISVNDTNDFYQAGIWDDDCTVSTDGSRDGKCSIGPYGGVRALTNTFTINDAFEWENVIFLNDSTANIGDNDVFVTTGQLKFSLSTFNWTYNETLTACMTSVGRSYYGDYDSLTKTQQERLRRWVKTADGRTMSFGEYTFDNNLTAECIGYDDIVVTPIINTHSVQEDSGTYSVSCGICYTFSYCQGGNVIYDPFVYYEGEDADSNAVYYAMNYIVYLAILTCVYLC